MFGKWGSERYYFVFCRLPTFPQSNFAFTVSLLYTMFFTYTRISQPFLCLSTFICQLLVVSLTRLPLLTLNNDKWPERLPWPSINQTLELTIWTPYRKILQCCAGNNGVNLSTACELGYSLNVIHSLEEGLCLQRSGLAGGGNGVWVIDIHFSPPC